MFRPTLSTTLGIVALAAVAGLATPASAGTSWSVTIAGPVYDVATAAPGYWAPRYVSAPPRYWHRTHLPRRVVVTQPIVVYRAPVVYREVVYSAPRVVYPAPRVVYPAPVVVRPW